MSERKAALNRARVNSYEQRRRDLMQKLWLKAEELARVAGDLDMWQQKVKEPERVEMLLQLLDTAICRLEGQLSETLQDAQDRGELD